MAGFEATKMVYAVSQAMEIALGKEVHLRIQGMIPLRSEEFRYKKRNVFSALCSVFPLIITSPKPPKIDRIGLITFSARPCDKHPYLLDRRRKGYNLLMRSYQWSGAGSGYRMENLGTRTRIILDRDLENPPCVKEEITRLFQSGCRHILYLAHRFEDRRIARSDSLRRFYDNPAFLRNIRESFEEDSLFLYPLVRDVFPGFRFRRRPEVERGVEITDIDHFQLGKNIDALHLNYTPVYTLGTLKIVGQEENKPQSGLCTYFFLNDSSVSKNKAHHQRIAANIMLPESGVRDDLVMALRAVHFLESEKYPRNGAAFPVLDPYTWMHPATIEGIGDIHVSGMSRVVLSMTAVLSRISRILDQKIDEK